MKKLFFILSAALLLLASCSAPQTSLVPRAVNTINSITLKELNLDRNDYEIINTVEAEAYIKYDSNYNNTRITISDDRGEFQLKYLYDKKKGWSCRYSGIVRFGYLANDYVISTEQYTHPEEVARRLAIYRLINIVNEYGADGVLEPVISTNVESKGDYDVFYTSVKAKMVIVKNDK